MGKSATRTNNEQTHRTLRLLLTHTDDGEDFHYIDLAKQLSAVNRRFYRQGMCYHIANITVHDSSGDLFIKFCTMPNTWSTSQAWRQGLKYYMEQYQRSIGDDFQARKGKWFDYKIYLNDDHKGDVDKPNFKDTENDVIMPGEWDYSQYFSPDGTTASDVTDIVMMGDQVGAAGSVTSVSLLEEWENRLIGPSSSGTPAIPAALSSSFFSNMFDAGTQHDEIIQDLEGENDMPPYERAIPGGSRTNAPDPWVMRETALDTVGTSIAHVGGFAVPCGLLCVETKSADTDNIIELLIELVPGPYKGVAAESMGTPKLTKKNTWRVGK